MAKFPALTLWTDAYLADTRHLTTLEHGAYLLLLITAWRSPDFALPNDDRFLRLAAGNPRTWSEIKPTVMAFWTLREDGKFHQKRLSLEASRATAQRDGASKAGKASAMKRQKTASTPVENPLNEVSTSNQLPLPSSLFPLKTPYPAVGGEPEIAIGSQEGEEQPDDAQPRYRAPPTPEDPKPDRPSRANGTNPRARGTNPRAIAEALEAKALSDSRLAKWAPRLRQFADTGHWDRTWGTQPSLNPAIVGTGVFLPPALWDEFREIARARAGPGGKAA